MRRGPATWHQAHCRRKVTAIHPMAEANRAEIIALCQELGVLRLEVFGSAVADDVDPEHSDVDVLVEVGPELLTLDNYFALQRGLERILGRPVDVVDAGAVRNPYVKAQLLASRELLYAA